MRQIVKRASTNVKSRQVPPEVIEYWRAKIESFEDDIEDILKQESVEKVCLGCVCVCVGRARALVVPTGGMVHLRPHPRARRRARAIR